MNPQEYDRMRQLEDWYWWFVARREAALRFTEDFRPRREPLRILDAGCGTGALLDRLEQRPGTEVYGLDFSGQALAYTRQRGHRHRKKKHGRQQVQLDLQHREKRKLSVQERIGKTVGLLREKDCGQQHQRQQCIGQHSPHDVHVH